MRSRSTMPLETCAGRRGVSSRTNRCWWIGRSSRFPRVSASASGHAPGAQRERPPTGANQHPSRLGFSIHRIGQPASSARTGRKTWPGLSLARYYAASSTCARRCSPRGCTSPLLACTKRSSTEMSSAITSWPPAGRVTITGCGIKLLTSPTF